MSKRAAVLLLAVVALAAALAPGAWAQSPGVPTTGPRAARSSRDRVSANDSVDGGAGTDACCTDPGRFQGGLSVRAAPARVAPICAPTSHVVLSTAPRPQRPQLGGSRCIIR